MPAARPTDSPADRHLAELDRQLTTLLDAGYPALAGVDAATFSRLVDPLRDRVATLPPAADDGRIPFVLVVSSSLVPAGLAVGATRMGSRRGFTSMTDDDLATFGPTEHVVLPDSPFHLVTDVDTGADSLGEKPQDVLPRILAAGRTPLTIDEGVAVVTQVEGVLRDRNAFQLLGSRCGDKRVPGLWVSDRRPRLGWCWDGNHHGWLGMASAGGRLGP